VYCLKLIKKRRLEARAGECASSAGVPPRVAHFICNQCFRIGVVCLCILFLSPISAPAWVQVVTLGGPAPTKPEFAKDALGRSTPRGTVLGFLSAAHQGDYEAAARYLNTPLRDKSATALAQKLFVVLDRRLPARLNQLSDEPEGSLLDPFKPQQDLIGTISGANGNVDILVERVDPVNSGAIWLFASQTLDSIPDLYEDINVVSVDTILPQSWVKTRLAGIPLFEFLVAFVGLPLFYSLTALLSRLLGPLVGLLHRRLRKKADLPNPEVLPKPIRLLFLAAVVRWTLSKVTLPLVARQFWVSVATFMTIAGCVWLLIVLNSAFEGVIRQRLTRRRSNSGAASIVRLGRRVADLLTVFVGLLIAFHHFGVNLTPALAGLGVGGIAVALAAQKTLENVIGGASVIFDKVVKVGDVLKVGDTQGTVEDIGLRSTRIRTPDRTVISLPNGQVANAGLENVSARDKFWFHPDLSLTRETTPIQMRNVLDGINSLLAQHRLVELDSIRVRFVRFGASSLDVQVLAYVLADDWNAFLEIQQALLLQIMDVVQAAGTQLAIQSHAMYLVVDSVSQGTRAQALLTPAPSDKLVDEAAAVKSA
jgi:MscS family membrane protein